MRVCVDCGKSIDDRGNRAVRCVECQRSRALKERRERARAKDDARTCRRCGTDISELHGNAKDCEGCAYERKLAVGRRDRLPGGDDEKPRGTARKWRYRKHLVLLLVEQRGRCGICGLGLDGDDPTLWHVDEIVPRLHGGVDELWNLQVTHAPCRRRKGDAWEGSRLAQLRRWAPWKAAAQCNPSEVPALASSARVPLG